MFFSVLFRNKLRQIVQDKLGVAEKAYSMSVVGGSVVDMRGKVVHQVHLYRNGGDQSTIFLADELIAEKLCRPPHRRSKRNKGTYTCTRRCASLWTARRWHFDIIDSLTCLAMEEGKKWDDTPLENGISYYKLNGLKNALEIPAGKGDMLAVCVSYVNCEIPYFVIWIYFKRTDFFALLIYSVGFLHVLAPFHEFWNEWCNLLRRFGCAQIRTWQNVRSVQTMRLFVSYVEFYRVRGKSDWNKAFYLELYWSDKSVAGQFSESWWIGGGRTAGQNPVIMMILKFAPSRGVFHRRRRGCLHGGREPHQKSLWSFGSFFFQRSRKKLPLLQFKGLYASPFWPRFKRLYSHQLLSPFFSLISADFVDFQHQAFCRFFRSGRTRSSRFWMILDTFSIMLVPLDCVVDELFADLLDGQLFAQLSLILIPKNIDIIFKLAAYNVDRLIQNKIRSCNNEVYLRNTQRAHAKRLYCHPVHMYVRTNIPVNGCRLRSIPSELRWELKACMA